MVSALPATAPILASAVSPTTIATTATIITDVTIFTRTGRSANQPARRGPAGEGREAVTSNRPGVEPGCHRDLVTTKGCDYGLRSEPLPDCRGRNCDVQGG